MRWIEVNRPQRKWFGRSWAWSALVTIACCAGWARQPQVPVPPLSPGRPTLPPLPTAPSGVSVQPAFLVVLDAAHGGADTGARFADSTLEKALTLELSARLRSALSARGIAVVVTRDGDADLPFHQRAGIANHAFASACLVLHTTATGSGVHLFTSSLAPEAMASGMTSWHSAQAGWVTRSLRLSSEINSSLGQAGVPATLGQTTLKPLDFMACPAVAIEVAPLAEAGGKLLPPSDGVYRQRILDALATAMLAWSTDWKQQP